MSSKKSVKKAQPQKSDKTVQYVAVVVMLVVAAALAWMYFPKSQPKAEVAATESAPQVVATEAEAQPAATSSAPVCREFDSIPTARQYQQPPMKVDATKQYFAAFKMAKGGEFVVQLYPDKSPITVNSFVFLSCKGYFNGVTFHRVLEGFLAQGGDPTGSGMGGPGYEFVNEDSDLTFNKAGVVAMANAGRD
ncbi:MAG: peptidylprolyl isomerase, partial [Anaerolineales bacterium]|nr:peptidylprolyl isomerase [Anaerolineales bacterium]